MPVTKEDAQRAVRDLFKSEDRFESIDLLELEDDGESPGDYNFKATVEFETLKEFDETRGTYNRTFSDIDRVRVLPHTNPAKPTDDTADISLRVFC
ncbi:hypothetical protein [Natronococcus sp. A-GB7]|uniref:hypothetical protein n=1 Tax=Natronococcus sp. A-GB7 TaxID=3037649 RepID=UPI00241D480B|nr:hypothetical protein [Natronococcus sp. A-GB7]MDG5821841.1 hypothetical protein [Natronococcus sp. A-GB7]